MLTVRQTLFDNNPVFKADLENPCGQIKSI